MTADAPPPAANVFSLAPRQQAAKEVTSVPGLLSEVQTRTRSMLEKSLKLVFKSVDDSLFQMTESGVAVGSLDSFVGLRQMRKRESYLTRYFLDRVDLGIATFSKEPVKSASVVMADRTPIELSLVEEDALEEQLAVTRIVAHAENVFSSELHGLAERLAVIKGGVKSSDIINPINPSAIAEAFRLSLNAVEEIDLGVKIVVFRHFERHIMHGLGALYHEINHALAEAGVLPVLRPQSARALGPAASAPPSPVVLPTQEPGAINRLARSPDDEELPETTHSLFQQSATAASAIVAAAHPGAGPSSVNPNPSLNDASSAAMWSVLQELLRPSGVGVTDSPATSSLWGNSPPGPEVGPGQAAPQAVHPLPAQAMLSAPLPPIDPASIIQALVVLSNTNRLAPATSKPVSPQLFKQQLLEQMGPAESPPHLGVHEMAIDAVGLMFDHILKDSVLPTAVQAQLARLQLPYLKVAVLEPELFARANHPARRLLNLLGETGKGWTEGGDHQSRVIQRIQEVVQTVHDGFVDDPMVFEHQYEQLAQFVEDTRKQTAIVERRAQDAARAQERRESVQERVRSDIDAKLDNKDIPEWLKDLLGSNWAGHLVLVGLREGAESQSYKNGLRLVDDLLAAHAGTKPDALPASDWVQQLKEGLSGIGFHAQDMDKVVVAVQALLHKEAKVEAPPTLPSPAALPRRAPPPTPAELATKPRPRPTTLERVKSLQIGDWIEMLDEESNKTRGRISWIGAYTGRMLLVTMTGTKIGEKTQEDVAIQIDRGRYKLISRKPLFDTAMKSVIDELRSPKTTERNQVER